MSSFRKFTESFLSILSFRSHKVTVFCTDTFGHFQCCLTKFLTAAASILSGKNTMFSGTLGLNAFITFCLSSYFGDSLFLFLRFAIAIFQFPIFQTASFFPSSPVVNIYRTLRPGPGAALEGGKQSHVLGFF